MQQSVVLELFADEQRRAKQDKSNSDWQEKQLLKAVRNLAQTDDGKTFLWWLLGQTHFFQTSFTGNSTTYFREGERNIGSKVMSKLFAVRPQAMQELIEHRNKQDLLKEENPNG